MFGGKLFSGIMPLTIRLDKIHEKEINTWRTTTYLSVSLRSHQESVSALEIPVAYKQTALEYLRS